MIGHVRFAPLRGPVGADGLAVRAVAMAASLLVVPLRAWSIFTQHNAQIYALFPLWAQAVTLATFAVLGYAARRSGAATLYRAAGAATTVSVAAAAVQGAASWQAGAWVWWLCMAAVCAWVRYWSRTR